MSWQAKLKNWLAPKTDEGVHMARAVVSIVKWAKLTGCDIKLETNLDGFDADGRGTPVLQISGSNVNLKGGLAAIAGKWPGDETDKQIEDALNAVRDKRTK